MRRLRTLKPFGITSRGISQEQADRLIDAIHGEIRRIGVTPGIGHRRSDLAEERSLLFWTVGKYLIIYRTGPEETGGLA